jgi:hypothetical protein
MAINLTEAFMGGAPAIQSQGVSQQGGAVPFPLAAALILSAIGGGVSGALNQRSQSKAAEKAGAQNAEVAYRQMGLDESQLNPFRGANAQARSLLSLDRSMNRTPVTTTPNGPGGYASLTGGDYRMSPELMQWLAELRERIATSSAANPIVTPYGKAQTGNLLTAAPNTLAGQAVPQTLADWPTGRVDDRYRYPQVRR